jgi:hypothetical protein
MQVSEVGICTGFLVEIVVNVVYFAYFVLALLTQNLHDNTTTALK